MPASHRLRVCGRKEPRARCLSPPLSLSLPHKGGGNAVALLCPTPDSIRVFVRRYVHAQSFGEVLGPGFPAPVLAKAGIRRNERRLVQCRCEPKFITP